MNENIKNINLKYDTNIAIVGSPYYKSIYDNLLNGTLRELSNHNINVEILNVEGALEIPTAISLIKKDFEGFIALGCIIRGETSHYDIVAENSAQGLSKLGLDGICISNGILTVNSMEQAIERSDPKLKNKGKDVAKALISLLWIKQNYNSNK
tara:strand:- start:112 stop:570 length:459 start_codon:yes stop_codon:yes gene_type:complete